LIYSSVKEQIMGILDNAKQVAKAVEEIHNLDLYQRVLALHSDIIELVEENNRLRGENEELTKTVALKKEMIFKEPFYYREGDETPHCPACFEGPATRAIHLVFIANRTTDIQWSCPHCKHLYTVKKDRTPYDPSPPRINLRHGGSQGWMGS
jgi:hypothetical protein